MADKDDMRHHGEQTLLTLEQLSQTLTVMSHVVDRLKHHVERQLSLTQEMFQDDLATLEAELQDAAQLSDVLEKESVVVEINQRLLEDNGDPTVH